MTHEDLKNLASLYALGALDGEDLAQFTGHLSECQECRRLVREYEESSAGLAWALPKESPAVALRERVLAGVRTRRQARLNWAAAAAALVAVVLGGLWWNASRKLDYWENLLADPQTQVVVLKGSPEAPGAAGRVLRRGREIVFLGTGLPRLPEKSVYELWAIVDQKPVPAGLYRVDARGRSSGSFVLPDALAKVDAFAVTVEPEEGRPSPTGKMFLIPQ